MIGAFHITSGYSESVLAGFHHGSSGIKSYVRTVINHVTRSYPKNICHLILFQGLAKQLNDIHHFEGYFVSSHIGEHGSDTLLAGGHNDLGTCR